MNQVDLDSKFLFLTNFMTTSKFLDCFENEVVCVCVCVCVCSVKEEAKLISPHLDIQLLQSNLLKRPSFLNTPEWHRGHKSGN